MNISIERLLLSAQERLSWNYYRSILSNQNLRISQGWVSTIKILKELSFQDEEVYEKIIKTYPIYEEHLLSAEKVVKYYKSDELTTKKILKLVEQPDFDDAQFSQISPLLLNDSELSHIPFSTPYFVGVINQDDGVNLLFYTKRFSIQKEILNTLHEKPDVRKYLSDYDQVYGIKKRIHQFIDIVFINKKKNLIEFRLDNVKSLPIDDQKEAFILLQRKFESIINGKMEEYFEPVNFFPLINKLYFSEEGKVVVLGFTTDEASIKNERMRRQGVDLRLETYHKAGKNAVHHITPYKIAVAWQKENYSREEIELLVHGSFKTLTRPPFLIEEVVISKCYNRSEYKHISDKIISLLGI